MDQHEPPKSEYAQSRTEAGISDTQAKRWRTCVVQDDIAEAVGVALQAVSNWESEFSKICQENNLEKSTNFTPPLYNI